MTSWAGSIAVAGGLSEAGTYTDSIELFTGKDPQAGTWAAIGKMQKPRIHTCMVHYNGMLYIIGGYAIVEAE